MFVSKITHFLNIGVKNPKTAMLVDLSMLFFLRYKIRFARRRILKNFLTKENYIEKKLTLTTNAVKTQK